VELNHLILLLFVLFVLQEVTPLEKELVNSVHQIRSQQQVHAHVQNAHQVHPHLRMSVNHVYRTSFQPKENHVDHVQLVQDHQVPVRFSVKNVVVDMNMIQELLLVRCV
jgi:hypothetical protein